MAINVAVKALLGWVNSIKLSEREITIDDLQDGTILLKLVYMLKKDSSSCLSDCIGDRYRLIAEFLERDCRFNAAKGTSLSWDNLRDGFNPTGEIAKVLLLLIYHDMMNDRCTLNMLDCDVERELANLTGSFVMENDGCVYLSDGLDAYLARKYLPVSREIFDRSATTSTSNVSSVSLFSDDDSPVFRRTKKITFMDMETVASSSVSKSPLEDIMNTPKFQMRKMQRQIIKDRDYRDSLERELASKIALIAQRESHINQLQFRLDKLKEDQGDQEQVTREQLSELESKNNTLQMRLNEMLKQNKDFKSTTSLMERKVDELTDENGMLSSQMRAVCSKLAVFEEEVGRLTNNEASAQEEWRNKTDHLQSELNQATAQKELLTEQIQILQSKISCLEDEISKASKEEVGENMGPVMERATLEAEINGLKNELEITCCSLEKAEVEIHSKTQQIAEYQQEITQHKELLKQQKSQTEEVIQAKDEILDKLQKELTEERAILQQQIQDLKLQLEQVEQQKTEQMTRLQQHIDACEQEIGKLKEMKKEKEDLLHQTDEKVKDLETKLSATTSLLGDKEQQIKSLKEEVDLLIDETKKHKNEIQTKEEALAKLLLEKSNEQEFLQNTIQTLTTQVEDLSSVLKQAEQEIQLKQDLLAKTQQENVQQIEVLQQQMLDSEEKVQKLKAGIQEKNEQLVLLKNASSQQSECLEEEIKMLKGQQESLTESCRKAEEQVVAQQAILTKQQQDSVLQTELLQQQLSASEKEVKSMKEEIQSKEEQMNLMKADRSEQSDLLNQEIQSLKKQVEALDSSLRKAEDDLQSKEDLLSQQQADLAQKTKEKAEVYEKTLTEIKAESSKQSGALQHEIQNLKGEVETISLELLAKEQKLLETQQESAQKINLLQQQLVSANAELNQHKETQAANISLKEALQELQVTTFREKEALVQEKEALVDRILQATKDYEALEKRVEAVVFEKERFAQAQQAIERENLASRKLESVLQQEVEILKMEKEKLLKEKEKTEEIELIKRDLQEQLAAKSEAADHYKAQMENAVSHYNSKKQLLQKSQEEVDELKHILEVKEREVKATTMEKKLLQLDLDKAQTNEKKLLSRMASLEAQLACADHTLRAQNKIHGNGGSAAESCYLEVPNTHSSVCTRAQAKRTMSCDSLDQSSLEDSLNTTRKLSAPGESSTPLVRSSERLAAKRQGLRAESLETLYFTPINTRQINRTNADHNIELDSACKNPTSSVKRRRTTQVINITMTKKTPGPNEGDETFYSLPSARSHPNLSSAQSARPVSMELFDTPARMGTAASDQLIGLPGYRRSTIHSQATGTFCVGAENEPDGAPDDWLRIAELQARNKACLPHLKSSYPVESETCRGGAFIFTDEELRTGDPSDTIRRATMIPGQFHDSLVSHRQSLMSGHAGAAAGTRSHRLSLMPGQLPTKTVSSSQIRSPKGTMRPTSSAYQASPEKKTKTSCFPHPLTPKNKNVSSGHASSHFQPILSPAERRQSMMFSIDNTPRKNSYLKKGLNKLRSSTRKSPGTSSKKSPAPSSARKGQENLPSRAGMGRAGKAGNFKSPKVPAKGPRKSPQTSSRSAKSPGLTASARKKNVCVKEEKEENLAGRP
uniref:Nuclear mitotic apparatus protein 1 n=1 Tax=Stegastes partitus TaxID=144197 RepID=A0A3B5B1N0_9TELE